MDQGDHNARPATISFILPTIGRKTLGRVISQLRDEIGPNDEVIVVGDGDQPVARGTLCIMDARFHYFEHLEGVGWGNGQRDFGIIRASKDWLMFIDDDDMYWPGAINNVVRPALSKTPGRPHMFRVTGGPTGEKIGITEVMGPMFVPPNNPLKLVKWNRDDLQPHLADFFFIRDTLQFYPEGAILHPEEIYVVRPSIDSPYNTSIPKSVIARIA
jgi:glycosyltransferase involved in cell wall biosynthesis